MAKMNHRDFEKDWVQKFSDCIDETAGQRIRNQVLKDLQKLTSSSTQKEIIDWIKAAMERLDVLVDQKKRIEIMTGCACEYPKSELYEIRKSYEESQDIDLAHSMLQQNFLSFLRDTLRLDDQLIQDMVQRGWGLAGIKKGNLIVATKIPKSGTLLEYMKEKDPEKKRALYCHCPLIREAIGTKTKISSAYCYCGAGFYKGIWEYILQQPVKVEVLESVLNGGEVCRIAIRLPEAR